MKPYFIVVNWAPQDCTERWSPLGKEERPEREASVRIAGPRADLKWPGVPPLGSSPLAFSQTWRTRSPSPCDHSHCPSAHSLAMLLLPCLWGGAGEALRHGSKGGLCLSGCHSFRFCQSEGSGGCGLGGRSFVFPSRRGWDGCRPSSQKVTRQEPAVTRQGTASYGVLQGEKAAPGSETRFQKNDLFLRCLCCWSVYGCIPPVL